MSEPLRRISRVEYVYPVSAPTGTGGARLFLECGHDKYVKQSQEPKWRARCSECAYVIGQVNR